MLNTVPKEVQSICERQLGRLKAFTPASGGCINNGGKLEGSNLTAFVKWNDARQFPNMFTAEAKGLDLLRKPETLKIPEVLQAYEGESYSCLLLEHIESAHQKPKFWEKLGSGLAQLHRTTQNNYGLDHSNYMGSLKQINQDSSSLVDFFIENRLIPQVKMAKGKLTSEDRLNFDNLYKKLPSILIEEEPALVHGDLWSGNFMVGSEGNPVLIDPAVSFSSREVDLAMSRLFGGFNEGFYLAYQEEYPTAPGLEDRIDIYNLYPLLVHVNLFGEGYYGQVKNILNRFV